MLFLLHHMSLKMLLLLHHMSLKMTRYLLPSVVVILGVLLIKTIYCLPSTVDIILMELLNDIRVYIVLLTIIIVDYEQFIFMKFI